MSKLRTFTVEGHTRFPLDMLRYDQCWPKTQVDATNLAYMAQHGAYGFCTITMETWKGTTTDERWASFGWKVIR